MTQSTLDFDVTRRFHGGNSESVEANRKVDKASQTKLILEALANSNGLTCEELEDRTFSKHQSVSARCTEILRDGLAIAEGKRKTRSGCEARVLKLTQKGRDCL